MCPLRFILVFFSALLAGYLTWTTLRFSPDLETSSAAQSSSKNKDFNFKKMMQKGFWVFVDMASGKYLWKNLKSVNRGIQANNNSP